VNKPDSKVENYSRIMDIVDNRYPSDHFPVISIIKFN
jgi:hypothetical protein